MFIHPKAVAWVTGASSGLGEGLARQLVKMGVRVAISARSEDRLRAVAVEIGDETRCLVVPFDLTDLAAHQPALDKIMERWGRIDLLVNNAGISQRSRVVETSFDVYRKIFEVDFFGHVHLTTKVLPVMLQQRSGHIAVTTSVAAKYGSPLRAGYAAAKHALHGFFNSLRAEVWDENIKVSTIVAGAVQTDVSKNALRGDGSAYGAMDALQANGLDKLTAASIVLKQLKRGNPEIVVGRGPWIRNVYLNRISPRLVFRIMRKMNVT